MSRKLISVTFCSFACFTPIAFAQTATFSLTGVNNGSNLGGVYTSPYVATITSGKSSVSTAVICDDFNDDSFIGETWTADVTSLSSLPASGTNSTVLWQGTTWQGQTLNQAQEYIAAAILTEDLLPVYQSNATLAGEYGYAIWDLTDPGHSALGALSSSMQTTIVGMINKAVSQATGAPDASLLSNFSNVTIYSYDSAASTKAGQPTGCGGECPPPPQEFIVVGMPEPSMPLTLLFYASSFAALIFVFRKRRAGTSK